MDDFLTTYREAPRKAFANQLFERINEPMKISRLHQISRWTPVLAGAGALLLALLVFSYPPAQAWAQGFLDLFRVRRFAAITIDPARMEQIANSKIDFESLLGSNVQVVKKGQAQSASSAQAAAQSAGFHVYVPGKLPAGAELTQMQVVGEEIVNVKADGAKLQSLLDALQIKDVKVPAKLDGATINVHRYPIVVMNYTTGRDPLTFVQSRSPEVMLPPGVDLAQLGEIALRIVGLSASEAKDFARNVDWHTTLLVPVPANAASFREVGVRGTSGILITTGGTGGASVRLNDSPRQGSTLLWSEGDMVFSVSGGPAGPELVDFANSLQ